MSSNQPLDSTQSAGIAPSKGGTLSLEECLAELSPTMREDYKTVKIQGERPSVQARKRSVYTSTVCENVQRAHRKIQDNLRENASLATSGEYDLQIHPVGGREPDGSPAAIGRWTFQTKVVREVVEDAIGGRVLNACAGPTRLTNGGGEMVRNDINPDIEADYHKDICELGDEPFDGKRFDGCVIDPPFDQTNAEKHYEGWHAGDIAAARENLSEIIKPGGVMVECGWNSHGIGIADDAWDREALHIFYRGPCLPDMFLTVDRKTQITLGA